jgi:uncharacterized protein YndB with AHSA1/START domain
MTQPIIVQPIIVQREVFINAPIAHVWQLVATEEGLRQWWGNTIFLEAKEGGRCEEWRPGRQHPARWQGVVTLYAPPHQLMLTLRAQEPHPEGPQLTTIAIALEAKGDQTRVHVTQRAFGSTTTAVSPTPQQAETRPGTRQSVPLAQLLRPVPGTLPVVTIDSRTQPQTEPLAAIWQSRLTSLVAAGVRPV